jgi:hypothetical protein
MFLDLYYIMDLLVVSQTLLLLGILSKRLGEALQIRGYYLGHYLGAFLSVVAAYFELLDQTFYSAAALFTAVFLGTLVTFRYWWWLKDEFFGGP